MNLHHSKLLGLLATAFAIGVSGSARAGSMEDAILAEINFARSNPQAYAQRLINQPLTPWERALREGGPDDDPGAYREALAYLKVQPPLPPLSADEVLTAAAVEHVSAQGPAGHIGHDSPDGERFYDRLMRHGAAESIAAENIAYGPPTPAEVVRALIIDSGVPSRGHRRNIFHADFEVVGVSCGPHRDYNTMCVMDFAGAASSRRVAARSVDRNRPAE